LNEAIATEGDPMNTTTTAAAALQARVTTATIRTWARNGVIAAVKLAGRWVIDAASLARRIAIGALKTRKAPAVTEQPAPEPKLPWDDTHPDRALLNQAVAVGVPLADIIRVAGARSLGYGDPLRRREEGVIRQMVYERRVHLATPRQVQFILDLLAGRRRDGDTSGFYNGPTDRAGVERLTRAEASTYIDSLKGEY
jgi:hypothetical protein